MRFAILAAAAFLLLTGCGRERRADIASPEQMAGKDLLIILPSIPEQICYADQMQDVTDELATDFNGTNAQILSIDEDVDCGYYGFVNCQGVDAGIGVNNKPQYLIECISNDQKHYCFYLLGNEYRDMDGNTFDQTCVQGFDSIYKN